MINLTGMEQIIWFLQYWIQDNIVPIILVALIAFIVIGVYLMNKDYCTIEINGVRFRAVHTIWEWFDVYSEHSDALLRMNKGDIFVLDNLDDDDSVFEN